MHAPRVTVLTYTKNEGPFLLEWLAYHRHIGIGQFLIYTNDCEDESPTLLDRLAEMGIVTHVPNPISPGHMPQRVATRRGRSHPLITAADHIIVMDPDEFLNIKTGDGKITDLIATAPGADAICVQMRHFGDSGLATLPDGLIIENLTGAAEDDFIQNSVFKALVINAGAFDQPTALHLPEFKPPKAPRIFNAGGEQVPPESYASRFVRMPQRHSTFTYAQLNHYTVKTYDQYCAKRYRGAAGPRPHRFNMAYWNERNRNEVRDLTIQRHIPAVKAQMQDWLRDPLLAARHTRVREAHAEIVKKAVAMFPLLERA